jgi:Zn-dependent protease
MGPGFSLITTALFFMAASGGQDKWMGELALMSALLNGFNLLPVLPLDGGHIAQSLLSRFGAGVSRVFHIVALLLGGALALAIKSYLLLFILLVIAPSLSSERTHAARALPMLTWGQWALLFIAYVATFFFYIDVFVQLSIATAPNEPLR